MIEQFTSLDLAKEAHRKFGGFLLREQYGYMVCHGGCMYGALCAKPYCGRDADWLDGLAPSYDETDPANTQAREPRQQSLFLWSDGADF